MNFKSYFIEMCSSWSNWQYVIIDLDYGLALNRQQPIIWINDGLVFWRIYASLGLNELIHFLSVTDRISLHGMLKAHNTIKCKININIMKFHFSFLDALYENNNATAANHHNEWHKTDWVPNILKIRIAVISHNIGQKFWMISSYRVQR